MKIKFTPGVIVNIIIGTVITFTLLTCGLFFLQLPSKFSNEASSSSSFTMVNNLAPLTPTLSDSIPYYQYKRQQDSITQIRTLRNGDGKNIGSAAFLALWGTDVSNYCDTCTLRYYKFSQPTNFPIYNKPTKTYLLLFGWKINPGPPDMDSVKFHVEHGQAYLRKQLIDSTHTNPNGSIERIARTHDAPVLFGYSRELNCIKIPISPSTKNILDFTFAAMSISSIIYFLFFVIGGFIKFLIDLSRGQSFTLKNMRRLKIIGISIIAIEALIFFINLCMPLVFHAYFTSDVVLAEKSWNESWKWLIAGVTFLLLYKAFKSGKKIKDEQDLVI